MDHDALSWRNRIRTVLFSVSFFVLTLLLFSAARIYIGNFKEFSSLFHESILFFLIVSLVVTLLFSAALLLLSRHHCGFRAFRGGSS